MTGDVETTKAVVNRLKRAEGQLRALITAIEGGSDCRSVITQLSAVSGALDKAGFAILANAMQECATLEPGEANAEGLTREDVEKLFLSLA